jgi:hypothetical protein
MWLLNLDFNWVKLDLTFGLPVTWATFEVHTHLVVAISRHQRTALSCRFQGGGRQDWYSVADAVGKAVGMAERIRRGLPGTQGQGKVRVVIRSVVGIGYNRSVHLDPSTGPEDCGSQNALPGSACWAGGCWTLPCLSYSLLRLSACSVSFMATHLPCFPACALLWNSFHTCGSVYFVLCCFFYRKMTP